MIKNRLKLLVLICMLTGSVGCSKMEISYRSPTWGESTDKIYCVELEHYYKTFWILEWTVYIDSYLMSMNTDGDNKERICRLHSDDGGSSIFGYGYELYEDCFIDKISVSGGIVVYGSLYGTDENVIGSVNVDGTGSNELVSYSELSLGNYVGLIDMSPDSEKIIYYHTYGELWIMNTAGTEKSKIWEDNNGFSVLWSTDSCKVAITNSEETIILDIDTLVNYVVAEAPENGYAVPGVSPDGNKKLGETEPSYDYALGIWISNIDDTGYAVIAEPVSDK